MPASHITIGLQCGGSDGYSGITANPALGAACDLLVAHGTPAGLSLLLWAAGGLQAPRFYPVGAAIRGPALGDLDRDGRPDIVLASSGEASLRILHSAFR